MRRAAGLALAVACLPLSPARAQLEVAGYALGVGTYASRGDLSPAGSTLLARGRVMPSFASGPLAFEVAYEHIASRQPAGGGFQITAPGGGGAGERDWLGADWTIHSGARSTWRHRFDRLSATYEAGSYQIVVGRQAISWATTLFLTPADPFAPFDPSDPFREYRSGVDAVRVRAFPGPFTELELVVRAAESPLGTAATALARGQTSVGGWAIGAWGGMLHREAAGALFASGAVGATAVRSEVSLRESADRGATVRGAVGLDRNFVHRGRDVFLIAELQYDGFGTGETGPLLLGVVSSDPYVRGEMQVLGELTAAFQGSYQLHPLVGVDLMVLGNLQDGSALVAPGASWSATSAVSVRAGLFTGRGEGATGGVPASEYGLVPTLGYVAVSCFF